VGFSGKSVSIGITTVKAEELNFKTNDEIIKEADHALYQSKDNGKNSIAVFTSGSEEVQVVS
jgi:GGDEF domain-containing protein